MNKIFVNDKNLASLLSGQKFAIDYYQREYRWGKKQVEELIGDLADKFLENYKQGHERSAFKNYGNYFLGSIIISNKREKNLSLTVSND